MTNKRKRFYGSFVTVCFCLAATAIRAQSVDLLVQKGRDYLAARNITNANSRFAAAVVLQPNHEAANFFYAVTRLGSLASHPEAQSLMTRLGISETGRNLYAWTASLPTDTNDVPLSPSGLFSAEEVNAFFRNVVLPEIRAAETNLARIVNTNFLLTLTSNETVVASVTLDFGDVLLLRAFLHGAEYGCYTLNPLNLEVQLSSLRAIYDNTNSANIEHLLSSHPQLLTFQSTNEFEFGRAAFGNAVTRYSEASDWIRRRSTNLVRLFNLSGQGERRNEQDFRDTITAIRDSLNGPVVLDPNIYNTRTNYTVHMARQFDPSHSIRSFLPSFQENAVIVGTLPDITFGGLFEGVSVTEAERRLGDLFQMRPFISFRSEAGNLISTVQVRTVVGRGYAIQTSTNLTDWQNLVTILATNAYLRLQDAQAAGPSSRFYRAVEISNDLFANRYVISGSYLRVTGSPEHVGREPGEPQHNGQPEGRSVWWSWTARRAGTVAVAGSAPCGGVLVIYTGTELTNLTELARGGSTVSFDAVVGNAYQIVFDGYDCGFFFNREYTFTLATQENDDFANRTIITGNVVSIRNNASAATAEAGEPSHNGFNSPQNTLWWSWIAPANGAATLWGDNIAFGQTYAVYTGDSLSSLMQLGHTGYGFFSPFTNKVTFNANAGTAYQIAAEGGPNAFVSDVRFTIRQSRGSPDSFIFRTILSGTNLSVTATNLNATAEPGEPLHWAHSARKTVWWSWKAPQYGAVTISTVGSNFDTVLAVYTGFALNALSPVASDDDEGGNSTSLVGFNATAGTTYQIVVDGYGTNSGNIRLNLSQ